LYKCETSNCGPVPMTWMGTATNGVGTNNVSLNSGAFTTTGTQFVANASVGGATRNMTSTGLANTFIQNDWWTLSWLQQATAGKDGSALAQAVTLFQRKGK
jgi:hypothetical protein